MEANCSPLADCLSASRQSGAENLNEIRLVSKGNERTNGDNSSARRDDWSLMIALAFVEFNSGHSIPPNVSGGLEKGGRVENRDEIQLPGGESIRAYPYRSSRGWIVIGNAAKNDSSCRGRG
mgnify:CR=1 FL=1